MTIFSTTRTFWMKAILITFFFVNQGRGFVPSNLRSTPSKRVMELLGTCLIVISFLFVRIRVFIVSFERNQDIERSRDRHGCYSFRTLRWYHSQQWIYSFFFSLLFFSFFLYDPWLRVERFHVSQWQSRMLQEQQHQQQRSLLRTKTNKGTLRIGSPWVSSVRYWRILRDAGREGVVAVIRSKRRYGVGNAGMSRRNRYRSYHRRPRPSRNGWRDRVRGYCWTTSSENAPRRQYHPQHHRHRRHHRHQHGVPSRIAWHPSLASQTR